jgi:DNA-binding transcriptional LysR family regulator
MGQKRDDLNLISVFLEVFRLQSITLAAESLDLTQPAVSSALKRFREQVGADLFVRDGRGIAPTHTAQYLAAELEPMITSIHKTLANLREFDPDTPHAFRVFVTEPMLYLLQPHFERNNTIGNCRIDFELSPRSMEELLRALSLQRVDMALDISADGHRSYRSELVHTDELVLVCSASHPRVGDTIDFPQFYEEEHVALVLRRSGKRAVDLYARERVDSRNIVFECESFMSMFAMVSQGQMLCCAPRSLASRYEDLFGLKQLDLPFETRPIEHFLIAHSRLDNSPAHQWLKDILQRTLREI